MTNIVLSDEELRDLTGYVQAAAQLSELLRQGFSRARRDRLGNVVLERAHYEAVCRGGVYSPRPKVRLLAATDTDRRAAKD